MPKSHAEILVAEASASGPWNMRWQLKCSASTTTSPCTDANTLIAALR